MTPEDVELLCSPAAAGVLLRATEAYAAAANPDALALASSLRQEGHDAHLVGLALTQGRLRRKATAKLGERGARMLWTPASVEQATRGDVAAHRAARFAALGAARVADVGCGAGADLLALADAGVTVVGIDMDPGTAALARANAATEGIDAEVITANAHDVDLSSFDAAFVDPARRAEGHRRFDPESWSPPWSWVASLAERLPAVAAKVAPGIDHSLPPATAETEWVSVAGDVKEAVVWQGTLASQGIRRRATLLPSRATITDVELDLTPPVGPVGRWLIEPDGAVIRAGLVAAVATEVHGWLLDKAIAYVVTDTLTVAHPDETTSVPATAYGTTFEVLAEIPFALKRMRGELRSRGYSDVIVKKRGINVVPEELRRRLALTGDGPTATVVLTRTSGGPLALLVNRA